MAIFLDNTSSLWVYSYSPGEDALVKKLEKNDLIPVLSGSGLRGANSVSSVKLSKFTFIAGSEKKKKKVVKPEDNMFLFYLYIKKTFSASTVPHKFLPGVPLDQ